MRVNQMSIITIVKKRNRLSRAPWPGGWGHYAVLDKRRGNWSTVCHVSATDQEFAEAFHLAIAKLANLTG